MLEDDRIVGRGAIDEIVGLESAHDASGRPVPFLLMPAVSLDPSAGLGGFGRITDHRGDVLPRGHAHEVELGQGHA